jgi:hypothetical protein
MQSFVWVVMAAPDAEAPGATMIEVQPSPLKGPSHGISAAVEALVAAAAAAAVVVCGQGKVQR